MAKWSGVIGFTEKVETKPGIWTQQIVEKPYRGDLIRSVNKVQSTGEVNDGFTVSNDISIVADPYVDMNFQNICYVSFKGALWKPSNVDATARPRLKISIGGVYNGKQANSAR